MPVKKTTKVTKKPAVKSVAATKTVTQKTTTNPQTSCYTSTSTRTTLLVILNTILLVFLISNYNIKKALTDMEIQRVWWVENYSLIQEIYELDTFKQQQRFQIEQTLQALQWMGMGTQPQGFLGEENEFMPE
jgi:hypothetical protein